MVVAKGVLPRVESPKSVPWGALLLAISLLASAASRAEPLSDFLPELLTNHDRIKRAEADLGAAQAGRIEGRSGWLPQISIRGELGYEERVKSEAVDTSTDFNETSIIAKQLVYDFGKTGSAINVANLGVHRAEFALEQVRQQLLQDGVEAYLNVIKTGYVADFARQSEQSIKRLAELEDARVKRRSGLATDALQAKAKLAGAQAKRVTAEAQAERALNRFRELFAKLPENLATMSPVRVDSAAMPADLASALELAASRNLAIRIADTDIRIAEQTIRSSRSGFFPRIDLVGERTYKHDSDGVLGFERDTSAKLQLNWPLFDGLKSYGAVRGSKKKRASSLAVRDNIRREVARATKDAFTDLDNKRQTKELFAIQAVISQEFLDLAREERRLGKRSLLDLLDGETDALNALSNAVAAEMDLYLAEVRLIATLAKLDPDNLVTVAGPTLPGTEP